MVDAGFLIAAQDIADDSGNALWRRGRMVQQRREDLTHLRNRHRRLFATRRRSNCRNPSANSDSVM